MHKNKLEPRLKDLQFSSNAFTQVRPCSHWTLPSSTTTWAASCNQGGRAAASAGGCHRVHIEQSLVHPIPNIDSSSCSEIQITARLYHCLLYALRP